jgi:hypothetical protein
MSLRLRREVAGMTLPLLLPQPQARRVAIGELDAGLFQHALDRRGIVRHRGAPALLEIDDGVFGNRGPGSQFDQPVSSRSAIEILSEVYGFGRNIPPFGKSPSRIA